MSRTNCALQAFDVKMRANETNLKRPGSPQMGMGGGYEI
jgi:hypothetical protein